jgi:hypothetical protein
MRHLLSCGINADARYALVFVQDVFLRLQGLMAKQEEELGDDFLLRTFEKFDVNGDGTLRYPITLLITLGVEQDLEEWTQGRAHRPVTKLVHTSIGTLEKMDVPVQPRRVQARAAAVRPASEPAGDGRSVAFRRRRL